jgi:DNA-binding transcriptional MerR regulator
VAETLRIGELADRSGLATSAIRYYESEGVLPPARRSASGYRGYDEGDVELARFVARLRSLEFPLNDVREIVALRREGKAPCGAVRAAMARGSRAIADRIRELRRLQTELEDLEAAARDLPDNWPSVCVCSVIEDSP